VRVNHPTEEQLKEEPQSWSRGPRLHGLLRAPRREGGFPAVYASGCAIARATGVPDLGLISPDES